MTERMTFGELEVTLNRKTIKNVHISVMPPDGMVRVSAPENMSETAIRTAVIQRIPWIRKQQRAFAAQARQSQRQMVSGECHYLWGRAYRLSVIERQGRHEVAAAGHNRLNLFVQPETTVKNRAETLDRFYRQQLKEQIGKLRAKWDPIVGQSADFYGIKKMKTKWGSCNPQTRRIWINLELAKKPPECLEYIVVHELVHLLERRHGERFKGLMDNFLPQWQERRDLLNRMPLAHGSWAETTE